MTRRWIAQGRNWIFYAVKRVPETPKEHYSREKMQEAKSQDPKYEGLSELMEPFSDNRRIGPNNEPYEF